MGPPLRQVAGWSEKTDVFCHLSTTSSYLQQKGLLRLQQAQGYDYLL